MGWVVGTLAFGPRAPLLGKSILLSKIRHWAYTFFLVIELYLGSNHSFCISRDWKSISNLLENEFGNNNLLLNYSSPRLILIFLRMYNHHDWVMLGQQAQSGRNYW